MTKMPENVEDMSGERTTSENPGQVTYSETGLGILRVKFNTLETPILDRPSNFQKCSSH